MRWHKLAAAGLVLGGIALVMAGWAQTADAWQYQCIPDGPYYPARCKPAHQDPPDPPFPDSPMTCWTEIEGCVPTPGSFCGSVEGYGYAIQGVCEHFIAEHDQYECIEDDSVTVILMEYYRSTCEVYEGACQCVWKIGEKPDVPTSTCDCRLRPR